MSYLIFEFRSGILISAPYGSVNFIESAVDYAFVGSSESSKSCGVTVRVQTVKVRNLSKAVNRVLNCAAVHYILTDAAVPGKSILVSVAALAFLTLVLTMLWVYPVMVSFKGNLREILFNAFIFTFMYAPITLIAAAFYAGAGFLLVRYLLARGLVILFGQSLVAYANMNLFGKVFLKYQKNI